MSGWVDKICNLIIAVARSLGSFGLKSKPFSLSDNTSRKTSMFDATDGSFLNIVLFKKLPSVASNIEVLREVLSDNENGLLFNPNEPDDLATAMIRLHC